MLLLIAAVVLAAVIAGFSRAGATATELAKSVGLLVILLLTVAWTIPWYAQTMHDQMVPRNVLNQFGRAALIHADNHQGKLPPVGWPPADWMRYSDGLVQLINTDAELHVAINPEVASRKLDGILKPKTVLAVLADQGKWGQAVSLNGKSVTVIQVDGKIDHLPLADAARVLGPVRVLKLDNPFRRASIWALCICTGSVLWQAWRVVRLSADAERQRAAWLYLTMSFVPMVLSWLIFAEARRSP